MRKKLIVLTLLLLSVAANAQRPKVKEGKMKNLKGIRE